MNPLGRTTPRGTVLGFLNAARKGENELARQYLNTRLSAKAAEDLAQKLFVVLDARLPPRLDELSDAPEGSRANPLTPSLDLVGTISGPRGDLDISVERVERGQTGAIWLLSSRTLDSIPAQDDEVMRSRGDVALPRVLTTTRVAGVRLFEWLAFLLGIPIFYFATVLLNRVLTLLIGVVWRWVSKEPGAFPRNVLPIPARLLLVSLACGWLLSRVQLSLLLRQFWSNASSVIAIVAIAWLLILLSGEVEQYLRRRLQRRDVAAATLLLRLARRTVDVLVIFAGLLATFRLFAIDATPALAGLGVGGIAVALAAQKTLENVIAGASLIFDQAVRVGDTLKMGEVFGTVDKIGLRSTRIRTLDRTIVTIPSTRPDRQRHPRNDFRSRQVLVSSRRRAATRHHARPVARRHQRHPPDAGRGPVGRHRIGAGPVLPARSVLPGRRGRRLSLRARLGYRCWKSRNCCSST